MRTSRTASAALACAALLSCTGSISEGPAGSAGAGAGAPEPGGVRRARDDRSAGGEAAGPVGARPGAGAPAAGADGAGPWPLRRLTRHEFDNTLQDLLGEGARAGDVLPADTRGAHGFLEPTPATDVLVERLLAVSAELAEAAAPRLVRLYPCDAAADGVDACVARFIRAFGRRAFRRPLTTEETAAFAALDARMSAEQGWPYGERVRFLVRAFLQAPEWIYVGPGRPAPGASGVPSPGASVPLGGYEVASRLSYFLWRSMPDETLLAAAAEGRLGTAAGVATEARRLLGDRRARDAVTAFAAEWLMLEHVETLTKDPKLFPGFSERLRASIQGERVAFLRAWFAEDATLDGLLTARHGFSDAGLARLYGVPAPAGTGLQRVALPAAERAGVLTQVAFLADHADAAATKPVTRGRVIYEQLLCGTIPPPPLDVPEPRPATPGLTTRERFEEHGRNECARGCHALMDPPGFAFELYDALGVYRTHEAGRPIDASGVLALPTEGPRRFADAVELASVLARSEDARRCFVTKWARFALGREETPTERPSLERALGALRAARGNARELLVALATSRAFLARTLAPGEGVP